MPKENLPKEHIKNFFACENHLFMKRRIHYYILTFCFALINQFAFSQVMQIVPATTAPFNPINLIENVFLGQGVEVLNITYNGDPNAVGYFKLGNQDIGIYEGVVMSSGNVSTIPVANNTSTGTSNNTTGGNDADLTTIAGQGTFDAAIYTIEFIPSADTLQFNYVFGSEEYSEWVCTNFNDVFGFFISGPGIIGPYQNMATNIALLPNTNVGVAINTINNGNPNNAACTPTNVQYYVDNPPVTAGNSNFQIDYDGFTVVLTATAVVIPCSTYTIKLAISDAGDANLNSGVFLAANSFGTNGLRVYSQTPSLTNSIAEGCQPATINFELDNPADATYNLSYTLGGSAVYGVDYDSIPLFATIPQGQSSFQLQLSATPDNITEGIDTIEVYINVTPCELDTFYIFIEDAVIETPSVPDTAICLGDTVSFDATLYNVPQPAGAKYTSDTSKIITDSAPTISYFNVSGIPMFNVQAGTIDSVCIDASHIWMDDLDFYLIAPNGQFLELTTDNGGSSGLGYVNTCFTPTATTNILAGTPPFTGDFQPEEPWSNLYGAPVNGQWELRAIDDGAFFDGNLNYWSISFAAPYSVTYSWSGDTSSLSCTDCPTPDAFPDTTSSYVITVYDSYGCETYDTVNVVVNDSLPAPNVACDSVTTNMITINWNTIPTSSGYLVNVDGAGFVSTTDTFFTVTGLTPNQTVQFEVVADGGLCPPHGIDTSSCTTLNCSLVSTVTDTTDVSCFGYADGGAIVTAINGYNNYYYSLDGATAQQNDGTFTNLIAGTYQVIVSDDDNCADTVGFVITQPTGMTITSSSSMTSCNGGADGTATFTVSGGTPGYAYNWSTTPAQITPTATGLSAGMHYITVTDANNCSQIDSVMVTEPTAVTTSMASSIVSCFGGNDGTATITASGGTPNYTYVWSTTPVQTTATATGLTIGTYYVTITDANICIATDSVTITQNTEIILSSTSTSVNCSGGTDGTATVTASGGITGYTYAWSTTPVQTMATASNLSAGQYFVTVTDGANCTAIDTITVGTINPIIITTSGTPASCIGVNNGTATVSATGGAGGFTYVWSTTPVQTTTTATGLASGSYTVTVTDANGCNDTSNIFISTNIVLISTTDSTDVSCFGGNDGTATIAVTGGSTPYTYTWSVMGAPNASTITNLAAGTYTVTSTDANGCFRVDNIQVNQPTAVLTTTTTTAASCNGGSDGSATIQVTGGAMPYGFAWSTTPTQNTATATALSAGQYYVTVTDANNCQYIDSAIVVEPTPLVLVTSMVPVSCNGGNDGSAWVTISGGTAPYNSSWNTSPITNDTIISNLQANTYTVTVIDANGCQATANVMVSEPGLAMAGDITSTDISCNGGSDGTAAANITGGTGTYSYLWSNNQLTSSASNLPAGTHSVIVTDQNGCSLTILDTLSEPTAITLVVNQQAAGCFNSSDGIAFVTASGGTLDSTGLYAYAWNTSPFQFGDTAVGLIGGQSYSVIVTDANGCTENTSIAIDQPTPVTVTSTVENIACFGDTDGSATVVPSGGTAGYTYQWDANAGNQTTATATNLGIGTYDVTVTDAIGCESVHSVAITQPGEMSTNTNFFEVLCKGESTGTATIQAAGGTPGYTYLWDANAGSQTSQIASNLAAGQYFVSVTDASGCTNIDSVFVTEPAIALASTTLPNDVTCYNGRDGNVRINTIGGTASYEYSFDGIDFTPSSIYSGLPADFYSYWVKDSRGCLYQDTFTINEPAELTLDLGEDIIITMGEDSTLIPLIENGVMPFNFVWSPSDSLSCSDCEQPVTQGLQDPIRYTLTITDANGCVAEDDIWINVLTPRVVYVGTGFSPNNDNYNERLFVQGDFNAARVVSFVVYDRWGEKVFETRDAPVNDPTFGWDGTFGGQPMNIGVYGWVAEIEFTDGERVVYKGNTTLIR